LPAAGVDELVLDGVDVQLDVEDDELVELLVDVEDEVDDEVEVYGLVLLGVDELLVDVEDEELVELLVDVDVAGLDALGNNVPELIHADVVEDLDVPEEILCDVGVELVMLDAEVGNDLSVLEGILVDVDVAGLDVLEDDESELIHADVVEDLDVLILVDVGVVELGVEEK